MSQIGIDIMIQSVVNASSTVTTESQAVPNGKTLRILNFGGYDRMLADGIGSIIALQWGSGAQWTDIRAGGYGTFDIDLNKELTGDGVKMLRLVRINKSVVNKEMAAWLSALIL